MSCYRFEGHGVDPGTGEQPGDLRAALWLHAHGQPTGRVRKRCRRPDAGQWRQRGDRALCLVGRDPDTHERFLGEQLLDRPLADESAGRDDADDVDHEPDLAQDVAGHEHGLAARCETAQQLPHRHDARRIEPVRRFVKQEELGIVEQGGRNAQTLLHAERIGPHLVVGTAGQSDELEQLVDPAFRGRPPGRGERGEVLASGEERVERR